MKERFCLLVASGFYIGMIPGMPGTYASVATTLGYYLVYRIHFRILPELHLSAICLIMALGVFTSACVSRRMGNQDPQMVVIDEVAGQLTALWLLPINFYNLVAGTCLFRLFDIWKPYPIRRLESLKNGVGIMADDLLAGVCANIILQAANWYLHRGPAA
jgi:phosphatidylglycerophosphatase A